MGIKQGTCDERLVLYVSDISLNSTPEINITLYVNYLNLNKYLEKKIKTSQNSTLYSFFPPLENMSLIPNVCDLP